MERLPIPNLCAIYLSKGVSSWCKQRINTNLKRFLTLCIKKQP